MSIIKTKISGKQILDGSIERERLHSGITSELDGLRDDLDQELLDRASGDSSTLTSANSYTDGKIADLVNSAPAVLDTLKELADALGSDPNFATTIAGQIGDVQDNLDAEEVARIAADGVLQDNIDAEEVARIAADGVLQDNIDDEAQARADEDLTLVKLDGSRNMTSNLVFQGGTTGVAPQLGIVQNFNGATSADWSIQSSFKGGFLEMSAFKDFGDGSIGDENLRVNMYTDSVNAYKWVTNTAFSRSASMTAERFAVVNNTLADNQLFGDVVAEGTDPGLLSDRISTVVSPSVIELKRKDFTVNGAGKVNGVSDKHEIVLHAWDGYIRMKNLESNSPLLPVNDDHVVVKKYVDDAIDGVISGDIGDISDALAQEILDRIAGDASTLSSANSYTDGKVADLVNSAPAVLDTLKELADALGSDPNFATTVAGQIGDVQDNLDAEEVARIAADGVLQDNIDALELAHDSRLDALEAVVHVTREAPSGLINGSNAVYTLANTPVAGSEMVFLNGLLQEPGAEGDYTISGGTITFSVAPLSGFRLFVSYRHI